MAETPTQTAVLLIAHGSRHQPANDDLHAMAARFSARGEHPIVEACFLELAEPDIATGGSRYAARGATRVLLVPSNSRPSECNSSWFAHFDSDKMMRHHRDVEKDLRYGLLEPEPARFRRSSACFGS